MCIQKGFSTCKRQLGSPFAYCKVDKRWIKNEQEDLEKIKRDYRTPSLGGGGGGKVDGDSSEAGTGESAPGGEGQSENKGSDRTTYEEVFLKGGKTELDVKNPFDSAGY